MIKIGVVGCGYVFDHYMESLADNPLLELKGVAEKNKERAGVVADYFGVRVYPTTEELLADPEIQIVVNLTEPENHYPVSKAALEAGKHVYSEKPLALTFEDAQHLVDLAKEKNLILSGAPCSVLSETAQTIWKIVEDGSIGRPQLVYAELDDNPVYLMRPEGWRNESGAAWPYTNEYEIGCTVEHAGYYLTWLCAMFGPATSITAFSACTAPNKTDLPLDPPDSADFSVACLTFASGVVARLTCSIVGPYDHTLKVIGDAGIVSTRDCWHYAAPVRLEQFNQVNLNARKSRTLRGSSFLQSLFGVRGKIQKFASPPIPQTPKRWAELKTGRRNPIRVFTKFIKKHELVSMDFFRGVSDMAAAIEENRSPLISADFVLHVCELTLAMHNAGTNGAPHEIKTTFAPMPLAPQTAKSQRRYLRPDQASSGGLLDAMIRRLHKQS
ncbi:MAG: Gfo/Idh/MocA family oxidoreductase [Pseudomonadota bacterium]